MPVKGGREIVLIRPIGTDTPTHSLEVRDTCRSTYSSFEDTPTTLIFPFVLF